MGMARRRLPARYGGAGTPPPGRPRAANYFIAFLIGTRTNK